MYVIKKLISKIKIKQVFANNINNKRLLKLFKIITYAFKNDINSIIFIIVSIASFPATVLIFAVLARLWTQCAMKCELFLEEQSIIRGVRAGSPRTRVIPHVKSRPKMFCISNFRGRGRFYLAVRYTLRWSIMFAWRQVRVPARVVLFRSLARSANSKHTRAFTILQPSEAHNNCWKKSCQRRAG